MNEVLKLLKEKNKILLEIMASLKQDESIKQFNINAAADLFVEMLKDNPELKNKIIKSFQNE